MSVSAFTIKQPGRNAREAFNVAVYEARKLNGKSGKTGTIAEKPDFVMINEIAGVNFEEGKNYANRLLDKHDKRIAAETAPAGCIRIDTGEFIFFGYAAE